MAAIDLEKELRDLTRRVALTETKLAQIEGQFGFISGQLRDIQLFMHARFDELAQGQERLRADLPTLVADAVGAALRGR